jgi:hypothetical protein
VSRRGITAPSRKIDKILSKYEDKIPREELAEFKKYLKDQVIEASSKGVKLYFSKADEISKKNDIGVEDFAEMIDSVKNLAGCTAVLAGRPPGKSDEGYTIYVNAKDRTPILGVEEQKRLSKILKKINELKEKFKNLEENQEAPSNEDIYDPLIAKSF